MEIKTCVRDNEIDWIVVENFETNKYFAKNPVFKRNLIVKIEKVNCCFFITNKFKFQT